MLKLGTMHRFLRSLAQILDFMEDREVGWLRIHVVNGLRIARYSRVLQDLADMHRFKTTDSGYVVD